MAIRAEEINITIRRIMISRSRLYIEYEGHAANFRTRVDTSGSLLSLLISFHLLLRSL
jgi:hypothetical protein